MKRIFAFAAAGIVGSAIGAYSAATMLGLLPGDRRTMEGISISGWNGSLDQGSSDGSPNGVLEERAFFGVAFRPRDRR